MTFSPMRYVSYSACLHGGLLRAGGTNENLTYPLRSMACLVGTIYVFRGLARVLSQRESKVRQTALDTGS